MMVEAIRFCSVKRTLIMTMQHLQATYILMNVGLNRLRAVVAQFLRCSRAGEN